MKFKLVLIPAAREEFDEAADWYNQQQAGLGDEFIDDVKLMLGRIAVRPEVFPVAHLDIRQATLTKRFPFQIHFRIKGGNIRVISVFHTSRNPRIWRRRK